MKVLTGPQRAATVIAQLDQNRAAKVLRSMSEREVLEIMGAIVNLPVLDTDEVRGVLEDFNAEAMAFLQISHGGIEVARKLLESRVGKERADEVLGDFLQERDAHPLMFLQRIDVRQVASFLNEEHPQTVAVVLAHMPPEFAAQLLADMDEDLRAEIVRRLGNMGRISPTAIKHVAEVLEAKASTLVRSGATSTSAVGGVTPAVAILSATDRATEKQILSKLEEKDPSLAEAIRNEMFVFDDVVGLDDRTMQMVLRHVVPKDLAVALKGGAVELRHKFMRNMSERAAGDLEEEIESLGPIRVSQVEGAQSAVVKIVRDLEAAGEIQLSRGGDDEFI